MSDDHHELLSSLITAGPPAVRELVSLLDSNDEGVRLKAASALAKFALEAAEQAEIVARLSALEARV